LRWAYSVMPFWKMENGNGKLEMECM